MTTPRAGRFATSIWVTGLLLAGDLLIVLLLFALSPLSPPPLEPDQLAFLALWSLGPLVLLWVLAAALLGAFRLVQPPLSLLARTALAALISLPPGLLARSLLSQLLARAGLAAFSFPLPGLDLILAVGLPWLGGLLVWRAAMRVFHLVVEADKPLWLRLPAGLCLAAAALLLAALLFPWLYSWTAHARQILARPEEVDPSPAAVVFGAGLTPSGAPSSVLANRVTTAVELYRAGRVEKLLLSGDGRSVYYNEPGAMQALAIELGVPPEDLLLDYLGLSTYDTCYRAGELFGLRRAVLVTQGFQLPRALFLCNQMGVESVGLSADRETDALRQILFRYGRELLATSAAWWDLFLARHQPPLVNPTPALH